MWLSSGPRYAHAKRQARRPFQPRLENLEHRLAPATFTVLNTNDSGADSFRQAILDANAAPGADLITFNIGGGGVQTIAPTSALPNVTGPVTIDGTTQPGFAGSPIIELSGASAGSANGLVIIAGSSTVRGLVLNRFSGSGIAFLTSGGNVVEGNHIGTNVAGTAALGNGVFGVFVGTAANRIGTNGDGVGDDAERNVISGNLSTGIQLQGAGADNNVVAGNYIGTDVSGTLALGNGGQGINFGLGASSNVIGTNGDGVGDAAESNVISGNGVTGVRIADSGSDQNIVAGNLIGTDKTGTVKLANQGGVFIGVEAQNNRIGTDGNGVADALERNVISGNRNNGIRIDNADANVVAGNYIGTDVSGTFALGNTINGVAVFNGSFNRIGTNGDGVADSAEGNLISGQGVTGVSFGSPGLSQDSHSNVVAGNLIGTDKTGMVALANHGDDIYLGPGAHDNRIGTNADGLSDALERNIISGATNNGLRVDNAQHNTIAGNYIGTNLTGTAALGNGQGFHLHSGAQGNLIGTNGDGVRDDVERNVISGNGTGILMQFAGTSDNIVAGNFIGTDASGTGALGNRFNGVFMVDGATRNRVGTDGNGVADTAERNLISGNGIFGVHILNPGTENNVVAGNYIGTDVTGAAALSNGNSGIRIENAANNTVGGTTAAARNVVSANGNHGIDLFRPGAAGNVVIGNYVGTNAAGTSALGNTKSGIAIDLGAHDNCIGTDGDGLADAVESNVIAGNGVTGVALSGLGTNHNVVAGNFIGTDKTGTLSIPHPGDAVTIGVGAQFNRIGTNADGVADTLERNILARSLSNGIRIDNAHNNVVAGNYIGTTSSGAAALANGTGVLIHNGATGNRIGTNGDGIRDDMERNVVSGNTSNGFFISVTGTNNNVVAGNYIGTTASGTAALANGLFGVVLVNGPRFNRIGTDGNGVADDAERNVISGNGRHGVFILNPGTENNVVAGNYVGTDVTGAAALGNGQSGIMVESAANNIIGGTTAAARNIVAANGLHGIVMFRPGATGNFVAGNYVGTNAAGTAPLGNVSGGIALDGGAHHNRVGTDGDGTNDAAEGNLISGNQDGVILFGAGTDHNLVAGNRIGTDWTGAAALPNVLHGVLFLPGPRANQIGGSPALANTIAFNGDDGILLLGATTLNNRLQANSIHSNGDMGIDLLNDDFTLNDDLDADAGPNELQNFPVIISSTPGATTTIFGRFHSRPNTTYTLDFYANAAADPSGFGEGQRYLGAATVTTDANGDVHYFTVAVPGASAAGEVISATATDPDGNTSEFSGNRAPTASAGGPYAISEGAGFMLDASASADPDVDALTYTWDVNGDGVFGDATGVQPTLNWAQLEALGINDGPQTISVRVRVDDDAGHIVTSPGTTLTVANVVPTASVAGPANGVRGQTRTFMLSAADLSAGDQAAGFVYVINWGDGSPLQTVTRAPGNGSGVGVDHVFAEIGTYTVTVNAADKDGGVSAAASMATEITVVALQPDPSCDCGKTLLAIGGTPVNDHIVFNPGSGPGDVKVILNGVSLGTFSPTGRIIAYGQSGDDNIQVAGSISLSAWLYGDAGDDRLKGGAGNDVLLGGIGADLLTGSQGRDLLIGGVGADRIVGNADDDILIAGITAYDADSHALCAIVHDWARSDLDNAARVALLLDANQRGGVYLGAATIGDDDSDDVLTGSSGIDWFFFNSTQDRVTDLHDEAFQNDLDFINGS